MTAVEVSSEPLHCPTCRAPWRGVSACPRCGTDLAPLMGAAARAWQLREAARAALEAGRGRDACNLASAALRLHATARGRRLQILALLAAGRTLEAARALPGPQSLVPPAA
jgi:hypothetical protein